MFSFWLDSHEEQLCKHIDVKEVKSLLGAVNESTVVDDEEE